MKGILGLFKICLEVHGACCHCSPFDSHSGGGTLVLWQSKQCSCSVSECSELIHVNIPCASNFSGDDTHFYVVWSLMDDPM